MDNELSKIIGQRINKLLVINNVKQKDLAEYLGVPDNTISYFCNGKRMPNTEQIKKIAQWECFNTSADYLLGITEVASADKEKEIDFISKYTGLSERAIEVLSIYNKSKRTKTEFTPIIDKLLKSHKLTYICCCIDEFSEAIEQKNNVLDCLMTEDIRLSDTHEDKEKGFEEYEKLTDKADLNLFRLQEAITDFAKICCWNTLKEVYKKEDIFNDVINNYIGEEENVFVNYLEVDGENNGNNPKT